MMVSMHSNEVHGRNTCFVACLLCGRQCVLPQWTNHRCYGGGSGRSTRPARQQQGFKQRRQGIFLRSRATHQLFYRRGCAFKHRRYIGDAVRLLTFRLDADWSAGCCRTGTHTLPAGCGTGTMTWRPREASHHRLAGRTDRGAETTSGWRLAAERKAQ